MFYGLNPNIGLRTWWYVPCAYYEKGKRNAEGLSRTDFDFLLQCDSLHDLPENELSTKLMQKGMIFRCGKGEANFTEWQYRKCENRYFPALNWMITGKCNYNCRHCFNAKDHAALNAEFTPAEAEQLLNEAQRAGIHAFTLTGGEPMLHKHFFEIIEGIVQRDMFVEELNTNGAYLTDAALARFKSLDCSPLLKISFDGLKYHDWMRNHAGAEQQTLNAIRKAVQAGFRVKVQMNVNRVNMDTVLESLELLDRMGVTETRLIRTSESPRWLLNQGRSFLSFEQYYDFLLQITRDYIGSPHQMTVDMWLFLWLDPKGKDYAIRPIEYPEGCYSPQNPLCRGCRGMVAVCANGNAVPCLQLSGTYEQNGVQLGNVKKVGLLPLLQSGSYLKEICMPVEKILKENSKCAACKYFRYCCGGCIALSYAHTGSLLGEDPSKCVFFESGYVKKITDLLAGWTNHTPISVQ